MAQPTIVRRAVRRRVVRSVDHRVKSLDDSLGYSKMGRKLLDHIFPDHWSFMLGEIALYSFIVLVVTGIFLAFYFDDSLGMIIYRGPYTPLDGQKVSSAYASTVDISFAVRNGLLFRQMHHWAANVFIGAIVVHLLRVFFTSAYRRPRHINWCVGVTMLFLAIINGYAGYSLPDDLMSGTGLRIGYSILESIPIVGTYLAYFLFGGQFPGDESIDKRLYIAHVFILPAAIAVLLAVHLSLIFKQKHSQFAQEERTEKNVVGSPLFPNFAFKSIGLMFAVGGTLAVLAGVVQINPIWQYGPFESYKVSLAAQPDWYMGWIEGAMRLMPNWEFSAFGHTIPFALFIPAVMMPVTTYILMMCWPFIDMYVTGDRGFHHLLKAPTERPAHTAVGAGIFTFFAVMFISASDDLMANFFHIPIQALVYFLWAMEIVLPFVVGFVVWRICREFSGVRPAGQSVALVGDRYQREEISVAASESELSPVEVPDGITGLFDDEDPPSAALVKKGLGATATGVVLGTLAREVLRTLRRGESNDASEPGHPDGKGA